MVLAGRSLIFRVFRRKDFSTTQIKIKMLTEEDFDETGSRKQG